LDIPPKGRVIIAVIVVIEVGVLLDLPREPDAREAGGGDGAARVGRDHRGAEVVALNPVELACAAVGHRDRERHVTAQPIVAAKGRAVAYLGQQPDIFGAKARCGRAIFADDAVTRVIGKAPLLDRTTAERRRQADALVEPVVQHRLRLGASARITRQPRMALGFSVTPHSPNGNRP